MKKFLTGITVMLIIAVGILAGIKVYPYIRLALETKAVLKENGSYQLDCYHKSVETEGIEFLFPIYGNKANGMISGTIGEEKTDSFVIDSNNAQAYVNIIKLGVLMVESAGGNSEEKNWLMDQVIEYVNKFEDSGEALYITLDQVKQIVGNSAETLLEYLMPIGLFMGNTQETDFKIKKVKMLDELDAEGMYLFKIEETYEGSDFYLAVDKIGKKGNSFQVICVNEGNIIKADISFVKDDTVSVQTPDTIVSDNVIEFVAKMYQIGTGTS